MQQARFFIRVAGAGLAAFFFFIGMARADDWPQWGGPGRDEVWRERGILQRFPEGGPKVLWRAEIGAGYAGPAVAGGRVFVTDRQVSPRTTNPSDPFARSLIPGSERVLCLEAASGRELWRHEYECPYTVSYPAGPRATPLVDGDRVYTLGTEGDLICLRVATGEVVWSRKLTRDFGIQAPLWGFSASPIVEGDRLIALVGGTNSLVVAFDKHNGKELWRALGGSEPGYAAPILCNAGGVRQLIVWHPEAVSSLNPATGELYWSEPFKMRYGLSLATPRVWKDYLLVSAFYNGSMVLKLDRDRPTARVVWRAQKPSETDTLDLHSLMVTPLVEEGWIYGICSYGQMRCVRLEDGSRAWEDLRAATSGQPARWATAFMVKNGARTFLFNEQGDLIIAELTPAGYREIDRAHLLEPTGKAAGRPVVWSHPAFANRAFYGRNDRELVAVSLAAEGGTGEKK